MSSRLEALRKYKENKDNEQMERENVIKNRQEELMAKIRELKPRIDELIETANECIECGINIDRYGNTFSRYLDNYKNGTFVTNGISHRVGFVRKCTGWIGGKQTYNKIEYIGIDNGGCNGVYDFRTNGVDVEYVHEENSNDIKVPSIYDLEKFLKGFNEFEKCFYEYVDEFIEE